MMFSDNLSLSVLRLCDARKLSYEAASELCQLSPRYFGSVARGQTAPTITTLEKLCVGFELTPNDLLLPPSNPYSFRLPLAVTSIQCLFLDGNLVAFPVCPRCNISLDREYQPFCDRCGQRLDWSHYHNAIIRLPPR